MELNFQGHCLYYELHGPPSGQPVVLLHHGLGAVSAWKMQIPALVEAGFYVVAYDRWGYGRSDPKPRLSMPTFDDDQADLAALVDHLELPRIDLVGHSDGGTISLYYAAANPARVGRLISIAAHIYLEPKMEEGIQAIRLSFENTPRIREGLQRIHGAKTQALFETWYNGWHAPQTLGWDMRPVVAHIQCPVLVVQGMQDDTCSPQQAMDLAAAIPKGELWLTQGETHMLPQEMPEAFNHRMVEFLLTSEYRYV